MEGSNTPDLDALAAVVVQYATAIDTRDWSLFELCFAPGCRVAYDDRAFVGIQALTRYMERVHRHLDSSLHRVTNLHPVRGTAATTRAYVDALLIRRDHPEGPLFHAVGTYLDTWLEVEGGWRIHERVYRTAWLEGSPEITG